MAAQLGLVAMGSAVGGVARHAVGLWLTTPAFPGGTLAVNVAGSFVMAMIMGAATHGAMSSSMRLLLATGAMGGFTTYSAFSFETVRMLGEGRGSTAALYVLVTVVGCGVASALGWAVSRWALQ